MNFDKQLNTYISAVEAAIGEALPKIIKNKGLIAAEAMEYGVKGGGKRLRPVILLASCEAFGGGIEDALPFAAALEMIHSYSLIHDDLPAMDDDDFRRGKSSCHKRYGEAYAILAGDALLNRAYETVLEAIACGDEKRMAGKLHAAQVIAAAAGIDGMVGGQSADVFYENKEIDEQTLVYINENKTGALISAAFAAGALIGGANEKDACAFAEAGTCVGKAFQIRDDVLDGEGSFEKLGKPIGSDAKNNKTTYFTLLGAEECNRRIIELTAEAVSHLSVTSADTGFIAKLISDLTSRNA